MLKFDENALDGRFNKRTRIVCPYCHGERKVVTHDAETFEVINTETCVNCDGLGYEDLHLLCDQC